MLQHSREIAIEEWQLCCCIRQWIGCINQTALDTVVSCSTVRETELQVWQPAGCTLHEFLLAYTPCEGCWWEVTPTVACCKLRRCIGTEGSCEEIFLCIRVVDTAEVRQEVVLTADGVIIRESCTSCLVSQSFLDTEGDREGYGCRCVALILWWRPLLTYEYIEFITSQEGVLCIVCQGIGITPVLVVLADNLCLWLTWITELRVAWSVCTPSLVCLLVAPWITEFRTEGDALEWLPVQAGIVVLTETALLLVGIVHTLCRTSLCAVWAFIIVIAADEQRIYWAECNSLGYDRVRGVALVGISTWTQTVNLGISQAGIEVQCQPLVQLAVELSVDVVLGIVRSLHDALVISAGIADVVLGLLGTTVYSYVVNLLQASAAEEVVLPVVTLYRLPDLHIIVVTILSVTYFILIESVVVRIHNLGLLGHLLET